MGLKITKFNKENINQLLEILEKLDLIKDQNIILNKLRKLKEITDNSINF